MKSTLTNCLTTDLDLPGAIAFSTQRGCCDWRDPYDGFNACHYVGDSDDRIHYCRKAAAEKLGFLVDRLVIPRQTHSTNVKLIDESYDGEEIDNTDALVTNRTDLALCVNTADCVPVLLIDPEAKVCAAVHSGWRGTVDRIVVKTVELMCGIGALPFRIHAAMGPCICSDCFEVGEEVADKFREVFPFIPDIVEKTAQRPHVNLPWAIRVSLIEAGLATGNIAMPPACSRCNPATYFSARRLGIDSGRTLTAIRMK